MRLPSPPRWGSSIDVAAPADDVWALLVDTRAWPRWGPTVASAEVEGGGHLIGPGARGAVRTPVGAHLPFEVTDWQVTDDDRRWAWRVAGVAATDHRVTALGPDRCRVRIAVPWWAPAYLAVVVVALPRIRRLAEQAR